MILRVEKPTLLLDINVLLDVILAREPWVNHASALFDAIASEQQAHGYIAAHSIATVHYIVQRATDRTTATTAVSDILTLFTVVPLENSDFQRALSFNMPDYEDAIQAAACLRIGGDYVVTRNVKDFKNAPVTTRTPGQVLALLGVDG